MVGWAVTLFAGGEGEREGAGVAEGVASAAEGFLADGVTGAATNAAEVDVVGATWAADDAGNVTASVTPAPASSTKPARPADAPRFSLIIVPPLVHMHMLTVQHATLAH